MTTPQWIKQIFLPKFKGNRGKDYFVTYGKDTALIKKLLTQINELELANRLDMFFINYRDGKYEDKKKFYGGDATIPLFYAVINELEVKTKEFEYNEL